MARLIGRLLLGLVALVSALLLAVVGNTWRQTTRQIDVLAVKPPAIDAKAVAERLAGAVRFQTVSLDERPDASAAEFPRLHAYLAQQFPRLHATLALERVGTNSLLFTWRGSDAAARPVMLMAHQDVTPIAPGSAWQVDPFAGTIRDGFVWGRGAWDDKGNLMSMLEAVEMLVAQGFAPQRTIYLAFGHDEEAGGVRGASKIAALLKSRGVRLEFALDEGLLVTHGLLKGLDPPLALIGVAEKGILTLSLTATGVPGHSSMPPAQTAIGSLAMAVDRLQRQPMPGHIRGVAAQMLDVVAPELTGAARYILTNLWLFAPLVQRQLAQSPSSNAMLRTTTAPTMLVAGNKVNVLPAGAQAMVNFRLLPGDTQAAVIAHVKSVIADDSIKVEPVGTGADASPVSSTTSPSYRLLVKTVRETFPGVLVAPGLMIGATDARYMTGITDQIYRFSPVRAGPDDLRRFHGTDERISIDNYLEMIGFYHRLLTSAGANQ